jgi:hypothetical protein
MTYKSVLWLYPDLGLGLYIEASGNQDSLVDWALILILHHITSIAFEEEQWLSVDSICRFPESFLNQPYPVSPLPNDDPLPRPMQDFVGRYTHPTFGTMTITESDGYLHFAMGQHFRAMLLYNKEADVFMAEMEGGLWYLGAFKAVGYRTDTNGAVNAISMDLSLGSVYSKRTWFYRQGTARPEEEPEVFNPLKKCPECKDVNGSKHKEIAFALVILCSLVHFAVFTL